MISCRCDTGKASARCEFEYGGSTRPNARNDDRSARQDMHTVAHALASCSADSDTFVAWRGLVSVALHSADKLVRGFRDLYSSPDYTRPSEPCKRSVSSTVIAYRLAGATLASSMALALVLILSSSMRLNALARTAAAMTVEEIHIRLANRAIGSFSHWVLHCCVHTGASQLLAASRSKLGRRMIHSWRVCSRESDPCSVPRVRLDGAPVARRSGDASDVRPTIATWSGTAKCSAVCWRVRTLAAGRESYRDLAMSSWAWKAATFDSARWWDEMKCEFQHHYYPLQLSWRGSRLNLKLQRHHDKKSYYSHDDCGDAVTVDEVDDAMDDDGCDDDCENGVFHWRQMRLCYVVSLCYGANDRHDRHLTCCHLHHLHAADDYWLCEDGCYCYCY